MRLHMILALFLCSFLLVGCSKEDEEKELNTFFEGIVINSDTDEPLSNTQIELIGYPWFTVCMIQTQIITPEYFRSIKTALLTLVSQPQRLRNLKSYFR